MMRAAAARSLTPTCVPISSHAMATPTTGAGAAVSPTQETVSRYRAKMNAT